MGIPRISSSTGRSNALTLAMTRKSKLGATISGDASPLIEEHEEKPEELTEAICNDKESVENISLAANQPKTNQPLDMKLQLNRTPVTKMSKHRMSSLLLRKNHSPKPQSPPPEPVREKRSIHLEIAPDEESESMQVMITENKHDCSINIDGACETEGDDCIYTIGSVDYVVTHGKYGNNHSSCNVMLDGQSRDEKDELENDAIAMAGIGDKKKSKLGSFLKSGKKENSSDEKKDEDEDKGEDRKGSSDSGDGAGDSGSGGGGNRNNLDGPFDNLTYFGPTRCKFAEESTLPLHLGSESSAPTTHPSWTPVPGTEFKVRRGPNYPKNGKKEASLPSLYEVYCVRYFRSGKRTVGGATRIMPLPKRDVDLKETSEVADGDEIEKREKEKDENDTDGAEKRYPELKGTKIPDVLVVHFMLPYEPPNMFKQKDDGAGGECVYYLRPSQRFLDELAGRVPSTPATQLFAKWCNECESNPKMRHRFKAMALVRDIDKHNFGVLKSYNGKPVLVTESGRVCSGFHGDVRYLEMTANVHYWAFMAKKGFVSIIPKFKNMQMEVGFTIEAHTDSEMPECMLGSTVLSYISEKTGPMITPELQEPVHEHQS